MANHKSAEKRILQNKKSNERNAGVKSKVKNFAKAAEDAIASGDKNKALESFRLAQSEIAVAVSKGVLHSNVAARKTSRLASKLKSIGAA